MIYRVFNSKRELLAEIRDAHWPIIKKDDDIPVMIGGREALYKVVEVGQFSTDRGNKLVLNIYVK